MAAPGSVAYNADFNADTSQGQQSLKDYKAQIDAVKKAIGEQTREARQNFNQQIIAARAMGASTEELTRINQEFAQSQVAISRTAKDLEQQILQGNFAALESEEALKKVRQQAIEQIEQETIAVKGLAAANKSQHGAEIGGAIAGGAAIRTIDGGQNVRAVENFLAKTLGLGGAFQAIFPLVGAVAALQILGEMGEKLVELRQHAHEVGEELDRVREDSHAKSELMVADIELQNSKLEDQRDKISGHPGNGLRTGILEAKKAADEFLVSLRADSRELDVIFAKQHVGSAAAWFSDTNSTSGAEKDIKERLENFDKDNARIQSEMAGRMAKAKNPEELDQLQKEQQTRLSESARNVAKEFRQKQKDLTSDNIVADVDRGGKVRYTQTNRNDNSIKDYGLAIEKLEGDANVYDARNRGAELEKQVLAAKQKKELDEQAKAGRKSALEAQKQAAEAQRKQWEEDHAAWASEGKRSSEDEVSFWLDKAGLAVVGSANYVFASKKANDDLKKANEERRKVFEEGLKMQREFAAISLAGISGGALERTGTAYAKGQGDAARTGDELKQSQQDIALATRQASIEFDAQHGVISRYDAAVQLQALHTEQYTLALQRLQEQLAAVQPGPQADAQRNTLQKQIGELDGKRKVQSMQDSAAVAQTTVAGALKNANQQWLQNTQELAPQIASVYSNVISGMNDQLSNLLTGQKTSWSSFFRGIASSFAHIGLNQMEGMIAGAMAPKSTTAGSSAASTSGSVLSGLVRGTFGGFRAGGGPVEAGKTYIVGEKGPEPVTFGSNATMGTNRDLQSMLQGGGGNPMHIAVDARGASNPAEVEAAAHRAVMAALPHILSAGMQIQQERRDRMPSSQR